MQKAPLDGGDFRSCQVGIKHDGQSLFSPHGDLASSPRLTATLIPPISRSGTRYSVEFEGETIVNGSRDPETDLARALLAKGIVGQVKVIDAGTGAHRSTIDIAKAARLSVREGPLRFIRFERRPEGAPTGEDGEVAL